MLTFFRTNQQYLNVLLLFYLAVLRASTFIHQGSVAPEAHGILTHWLYASVPPLSMGGAFLSFFLVFAQAWLINVTIARYRVATDVSLLPGVFYCLLTSIMPDFLPLSSIMFANTFLILAIYNLYNSSKNSYVAGSIFDAGLWLGVASLFHFPYIFLVFWGIVGLGVLRGMRFKELFMLLIGISVPNFLQAAYCFWIDNMRDFVTHFTQNIGLASFIPYHTPTIYVKLGIVALLLFLTITASSQFFSRRNMTAQKFIGLLYWLILICSLTIFTQKGVDLNQLLVIAVPLGILLSMTFQRIAPAMAEALHMLLLMVALILQFEYLLV
jgi:hypothetical protein